MALEHHSTPPPSRPSAPKPDYADRPSIGELGKGLGAAALDFVRGEVDTPTTRSIVKALVDSLLPSLPGALAEEPVMSERKDELYTGSVSRSFCIDFECGDLLGRVMLNDNGAFEAEILDGDAEHVYTNSMHTRERSKVVAATTAFLARLLG